MTSNTKGAIKSQYNAALEMLRQVVGNCPDEMWDDPKHKNRFWHIAYHVLFYTHMYMQASEEAFVPWVKHREEYPFLGSLPWAPDKKPQIGEPYSKADVLEYIAHIRDQVDESVNSLDLEGASGFYWLPFNKLEHQFYNIRHLMLHTGELSERLDAEANISIDWVGMRPEAGK